MPASSVTSQPLYDRNFLLAMSGQTCFVIANTLLAHYARWIEFLGGTVQQVGWIMGASAVVSLLLRPSMGQWINRLDSRMMWQVGLGVFSTGSLFNLPLFDLSLLIYVARSLILLGAAVVFASSLTYITQTTPVHRRTEAIGILGVGGFFGMLVGPALGDLILSDRSRANFLLMFGVAILANLVSAGLVARLRKPPEGHQSRAVRLSDYWYTIRRHWPGTILLVDLVFGFCMTVPFVFLASYVDQEGLMIWGVSVVGLFFWCYAGWGLTVRIALRRWPDQLGRRKVLLAGILFMGIGMFCYGLVDASAAWTIVIPALLTGTGHGLMFHTMMSLTIEPFPNEVRGTGSALALMMLDLGTMLGAPVLGSIAERAGFVLMFAAIGISLMLTAIAYTYSSIPVWRARLTTKASRR